jgi:hypothetical protein
MRFPGRSTIGVAACTVTLCSCGGSGRDLTPTSRSATPQVVAGVQLAPVNAAVRQNCQSTADWLGYSVPCPQILPIGSQPTDLPCVGIGCQRYIAPGTLTAGGTQWAFGSINFPASFRVGHLVIQAAPRPEAIAPFIYLEAVSHTVGAVQVTGTRSIRGRRYTVVLVPMANGGAFAGHTVLVWTIGGHTYGLGFHQHDPGALALDIAVVRSVVLVRPTPGVHHAVPWQLSGVLGGESGTSRVSQMLLSSVRLAAAPVNERHDCQTAALSVGFPVPCPLNLPLGARATPAECMGIDWTAYEIEGCGALARWATGAVDYPVAHDRQRRLFILATVGAMSPAAFLKQAVRLVEPRVNGRLTPVIVARPGWATVAPTAAGVFAGTMFVVWTHRVSGPVGGAYTYGLGTEGSGSDARALLSRIREETRLVGG